MSPSAPEAAPDAPPVAARRPGQYVVVARRYRPQGFEELIGQEHVAQALQGAITTDRVGHAYLFTGARGVGKTSAARILAKALNCTDGPTPTPCNQCDLCRSISTGDDVDVLEIDGASNRGIDEIRQLRQNVGVRPSRARFKIYIIDEVHMLTREAFNALLKTLEEPPEHVKFIFCTTEPTKIPITILSRCQRFDFAGIVAASIRKRLAQIAEAEGVAAEPEALEIIARRAAGSMRDGQSLLEQLLAFAPEQIAVEDVHRMLGTAGEERLEALVDHLLRRNAAAALAELDAAATEGVDVGQLLEQLFGYFRDLMAASVGCPPETFLYASPGSRDRVVEAGRQLGIETILAAMQILEQTLSRLRYSTQGRILAELALVRIASLEDLDELASLVAGLAGGGPAAASPVRPRPVSRQVSPPPARGRRRPEPPTRSGPPVAAEEPGDDGAEAAAPADAVPLTQENATEIWSEALGRVPGTAADQGKHFERVATPAPNKLVVYFKPGYTLAKSLCEKPEQTARIEAALAAVTGQPVRVEFALSDGHVEGKPATPPSRTASPHQRLLEISKHPMVQRAEELFGAHPLRVDDPPK